MKIRYGNRVISTYLNDIGSFLVDIEVNKPIGYDIETDYPANPELVTIISIAQGDKAWVFSEDYLFCPVVNAIQQNTVIGHQVSFDITRTRHLGFKAVPLFEDTLVSSRLLLTDIPSKSLDKVCKAMRLPYYDGLDKPKAELQKSFSPEAIKNGLSEEQLRYCVADVVSVLDIWETHRRQLYERGLFRNYRLQTEATTIALDFEGMPISVNRIYEYQAELGERVEILSRAITYNTSSYMQVRKRFGLLRNSDEWALQVIAHRQGGFEGLDYRENELRTLTKNKWLAEVKKEAKTPKRETFYAFIKFYYGRIDGIENVFNYSERDFFSIIGDPIRYEIEPKYKHSDKLRLEALRLMELKKKKNMLVFADRALDNQRGGRIKAEWYADAITGRKRPQNDNISQYPRNMKEIWEAPKGKLFMYADFSQQELKSVCEISGEETMYEIYSRNGDIHQEMADTIEEVLTAMQMHILLSAGAKPRTIAKHCNFLLLYGGGISNLQRLVLKMSGVYLEYEVLETIVRAWKKKFSGIIEWHKDNGKYTRTMYGRPMYSDNFTEQNNYQNQGSGADISLLALTKLHPAVKMWGDKIVNFVHDSFVIEISDTRDEQVLYDKAKNLADSMHEAWREVIKPRVVETDKGNIITGGKFGDTPMPVDVFVGKNWGRIEDDYIYRYSLKYNSETGKMFVDTEMAELKRRI